MGNKWKGRVTSCRGPAVHPVDPSAPPSRPQMRHTIKAVFPDRDAFTLLRPMLREEDLNRLDTVPYSKLRPEFQKARAAAGLAATWPAASGCSCRQCMRRALLQCMHATWQLACVMDAPLLFPRLLPPKQGMDDFLGLLRSKAHPLQFSGQMVTGRVYAQLAEAYVTALNQGAVPQLVTAWQVGRAAAHRQVA
jgi:hypothetical protein